MGFYIQELCSANKLKKLNLDFVRYIYSCKGPCRLISSNGLLSDPEIITNEVHKSFETKPFYTLYDDSHLFNNALFVPWREGFLTHGIATNKSLPFSIVSHEFGGCLLTAIAKYNSQHTKLETVYGFHVYSGNNNPTCVETWNDLKSTILKAHPAHNISVCTFKPNYLLKGTYDNPQKCAYFDEAITKDFCKYDHSKEKDIIFVNDLIGAITFTQSEVEFYNICIRYAYYGYRKTNVIGAYKLASTVHRFSTMSDCRESTYDRLE